MPKSSEADSGDREKPGVGVNLEARPVAVESGPNHNTGTNDQHSPIPATASKSTTGEETSKDSAETKVVEGDGEAVG